MFLAHLIVSRFRHSGHYSDHMADFSQQVGDNRCIVDYLHLVFLREAVFGRGAQVVEEQVHMQAFENERVCAGGQHVLDDLLGIVNWGGIGFFAEHRMKHLVVECGKERCRTFRYERADGEFECGKHMSATIA